jgi:hypothetical protein
LLHLFRTTNNDEVSRRYLYFGQLLQQQLKKRLLELDVDEEYIDNINEIFEEYYYKYSKNVHRNV